MTTLTALKREELRALGLFLLHLAHARYLRRGGEHHRLWRPAVRVYVAHPVEERDKVVHLACREVELRHLPLRRPYSLRVAQEPPQPVVGAVLRHLCHIRRIVAADAQYGVAVV